MVKGNDIFANKNNLFVGVQSVPVGVGVDGMQLFDYWNFWYVKTSSLSSWLTTMFIRVWIMKGRGSSCRHPFNF